MRLYLIPTFLLERICWLSRASSALPGAVRSHSLRPTSPYVTDALADRHSGGEVDVYAKMLKSRDQSRTKFRFRSQSRSREFRSLSRSQCREFFCIRLNFNLEILVPVSIDLGLQNVGLCLGLNLGRKNFDFGPILSIENFGLFLGLGLENSVSFNIAVSALADQSL